MICGDVKFRYEGLPENDLTGGIFRNGSALTFGIGTNTTSVSLAYIGDLADGSGDTDEDGLTDWEEIMLYHTDPNCADTDGDGLSDGDEVHGNADPLNPDTNGDGVPDGWTEADYLSHRLFNGEESDRTMTITLLEPVIEPDVAVLIIGDLPILLSETNSWTIHMPTGTVFNVELKTKGCPVELELSDYDGLVFDGAESIFSSISNGESSSQATSSGNEEVSSGQGSSGGNGQVVCPVIHIQPWGQHVHGITAGVSLDCSPYIPGCADSIIWELSSWSAELYPHLSVSDDKISATVSIDGIDGCYQVLVYARIGSGGKAGMSTTASVEFCKGHDYFDSDVTFGDNFTNAVINVDYDNTCDTQLEDDEEFTVTIEVGRETTGGWQHLAWIDEGTSGSDKDLIIKRGKNKILNWDMKAESPADPANGINTIIYNSSYSFPQALPAVTAGEYVPPPFVEIKTRTYDQNKVLLSESSQIKNIPQYVQITWDNAALDKFSHKIEFLYPKDVNPPETNVVIFAEQTLTEARNALCDIPCKVQSLFPSNANVIVVGPDIDVPQPHKTVSINSGFFIDSKGQKHMTYLGATPNEYCFNRNESPSGVSGVYLSAIEHCLTYQYNEFYVMSLDNDYSDNNDWREVNTPVNISNLTDCIAKIVLHECCHSMGLTPNAVYPFDGHNNCRCGRHYMDEGSTRKMYVYLGLSSNFTMTWLLDNQYYLLNVFNKE